MLSLPCSIHDDRLREIETEQASHSAQLQGEARILETIQNSIQMLHQHVTESTQRTERGLDQVLSKVDDLSKQVTGVMIEQARHGAEIQQLKQAGAAQPPKVFKTIGLWRRTKPYLIGAGLVMLILVGAIMGRPGLEAVLKLVLAAGK